MGKKQPILLVSETYGQLLAAFKHYVDTLGYSKNGAETKYRNALEFLKWLEDQHIDTIQEVNSYTMKKYHEYLKTRPHKVKEGVLSISTVNHHMHNLRSLIVMLQANGDIIKNPMSIIQHKNPPQESEPRTILSIEEIKEVYRVTETQQERVILALAYGCGLRAMELVAVNIDDIIWHADVIVVPHGKGNKRRVIPMSVQVKKDLETYIQDERITYTLSDREKALLLNIKGVRLRNYTCRKMLKKLIDRTKNEAIISKNIALHHLRHSIATHLLAQGVPVEHVRTFLGHSQLETTEGYTRVNDIQLKDLMQ